MSTIPDFSDDQLAAIQQLVNQRYASEVEIHLADSEAQLTPGDDTLTQCPVLFWTARDCNFAILRVGADQFRSTYFYTPNEQFSTPQAIFTAVEDCVLAVLQAQADHERNLAMAESSKPDTH